MRFIGSKVLETERLSLRPSSMKEQKRLWEILMIPEVNKWYLTSSKKNQHNPLHWTWEKQEKYYQMKVDNALNNDVFCWSIFLKDTDTVIGQISCQDLKDDKTVRDVGWFIDPNYQRKGYAKEASKCVVDYMFNEVEINAISSSCVTDNIGSRKIFNSLGFSKLYEKVLPSPYTFYDGDLSFSFFRLFNTKVDEEFFNEDNLSIGDIDESVVRVKAIIINDKDEITLGHSYNTYQFPGGHLEEDESMQKALSRELLEELGIEINLENIKPFFRVRYYSKNYRGRNINRENIIYYFNVKTNLEFDISKSNLDEFEKKGNYYPVRIPYSKLEDTLDSTLELDPINKVVVKEMKLALNEYNKLYR